MRRCAHQRLLQSSQSTRLSSSLCQSTTRISPRQLRHYHQPRPRPHFLRRNHTISSLRFSHGLLRPQIVQASASSYFLVFAVACGSAVLLDSLLREKSQGAHDPRLSSEDHRKLDPPPENTYDPFYTDMPVPSGHVGNLSPEQEAKLREFWTVVLKVFGVENPHHTGGTETPLTEDAQSISEADAKDKKKPKKRLGLFRKHEGKDSQSGTTTPTKDPSANADGEDKYGQVKEYQEILATQSPESLRAAFWSMVKADHPDGLLLRFLRARKWDVDKALVMLVSTMRWRSQEQHVDDDVVFNGEGGALEDSKSSDPAVKKEGEDFLTQLRLGKSFLHGTDKEGRPLCFVRCRLHRGGEQTERSLERYTVYVIETARLALRPPVETACIVFDMSHFTMANMDYAPVKFMIKIFEANYPESLGAVLVHKAPWIFQGIWKIIRGWLDPVVAGKVHFTSSVEDLEEFIPKSQIIKELGGAEDWEYHYAEPVSGENDALKEEAPRKSLEDERSAQVLEYQRKTFDWIAKGTGPDADKIKEERHAIASKLNDNYWKLDKYIRARTYYDRTGMISPDGKINFYPPPPGEGINEKIKPATPPPATKVETSADDVD